MKAKTFTAFGETKSIAEWVADKRCVVDRHALRKRIGSGKWGNEEAITTPPRGKKLPTKRSRTLTAFGETKTLREWSRDPRCAVTIGALWYRLDKLQMPAEAAITARSSSNRTRTQGHLAFGERKSLAQWAEDPRCHCTDTTLKRRLRDGWTLEKAITTPSQSNRRLK